MIGPLRRLLIFIISILIVLMSALPIELEKVSSLSKEEIQMIDVLAREQHLEKGMFWVREGKKADKISFIEKGYLRKFFVKDGKEITDEFYLDKSFSADIPSIVTGSY